MDCDCASNKDIFYKFDIIVNGQTLKYGDYIELQFVKSTKVPTLKFTMKTNKMYTIMMIDPDAPFPNDPRFRYWLHWLRININSSNEKTILEYYPPNPPKVQDKNGKHRYYICIYEQSNEYDTNINKRTNFNVREFVKKNQLKLVARGLFITENK